MIYLVSNQLDAFENRFKQISVDESLEILESLPKISVDTETTGKDCYRDKLLLVQLGNKDVQILYDIPSFNNTIPSKIKQFLGRKDKLFILQNAKFDLKFFYYHNVILGPVYDTFLAETILTNGLQVKGRDLNSLTEKYCGVGLDKSVRDDIILRGITFAALEYAAKDIVYLETIMNKQMKQAEYLKITNAIKLDNSFVKVLAYIEFCGVKLDWDKWSEKAIREKEELHKQKEELNDWLWDNKFYDYFDKSFDLFSNKQTCTINWNSPKQLIPFFESMGVNCTIVEKGEKKKSVSSKILDGQKNEFPLVELYLKYKEKAKVCSTYGLNWEKYINPETGRIHTTYKQLMDTGRLSSGNKRDDTPNLQNLPSDELTRSCFISEPGNDFIAVDYSAQESIVLANFSKDANLLGFYQKGFEDIHSYVAFLLFPEIRRVELDNLTNDELVWIKKNHKHLRNVAKTAEFAIAYGGNGATIAKNTGQTKEQGKFVYDSYFESFNGLKNYFDAGMDDVIEKHYILYNNVTGRKYFFSEDTPFLKYYEMVNLPYFHNIPDSRVVKREYDESYAEAQRLSQNYRIQGSSADISKLAGIYLFQEILNRGWFNVVKIVNMIHDK